MLGHHPHDFFGELAQSRAGRRDIELPVCRSGEARQRRAFGHVAVVDDVVAHIRHRHLEGLAAQRAVDDERLQPRIPRVGTAAFARTVGRAQPQRDQIEPEQAAVVERGVLEAFLVAP